MDNNNITGTPILLLLLLNHRALPHDMLELRNPPLPPYIDHNTSATIFIPIMTKIKQASPISMLTLY